MTTLAQAPTRCSVVSDCGRYRYLLTEDWGSGERCVAWVLLNPPAVSVPEGSGTIRTVSAFTQRWGYDRAVIVNLFARLAGCPEELARAEDPVGTKNRMFVSQAVTNAELTVVAWGDGICHARSRPETLDELVRLRRANAAILCFGLTPAGNPVHPAEVPDDMIPVVWTLR
jgi:hypothetical protein